MVPVCHSGKPIIGLRTLSGLTSLVPNSNPGIDHWKMMSYRADDILGSLTPPFIQGAFGRRLGYAVVTSRGFKVRQVSVVSCLCCVAAG